MNSSQHDPASERLLHTLLLSVALIVLGLAWLLQVQDGTRVLLPGIGVALPETCAFKRVAKTGCPGCGLTRSFISLAHGRPLDAWHYNPAGPLLFSIVLLQVPYRLTQLYRLARRRPTRRASHVATAVVLVVSVALLGQWVVRLVLGQLV